jgi:hypothetical protein
VSSKTASGATTWATFQRVPIVKRQDEQAHGAYRTKRVILEIYDAMQQAMAMGTAYPTRLDPPPEIILEAATGGQSDEPEADAVPSLAQQRHTESVVSQPELRFDPTE